MNNPPNFIHLFIRQFWRILKMKTAIFTPICINWRRILILFSCHLIMMSWRHRNVELNSFRYFFFLDSLIFIFTSNSNNYNCTVCCSHSVVCQAFVCEYSTVWQHPDPHSRAACVHDNIIFEQLIGNHWWSSRTHWANEVQMTSKTGLVWSGICQQLYTLWFDWKKKTMAPHTIWYNLAAFDALTISPMGSIVSCKSTNDKP